MARFRRSGTNWEGRPWTTTPALNSLLDEVEARWPTGNPSVDGTVASQGHDRNSPTSDHRPHPYTGPGVVRAVDIWVTSAVQGDEITETLRTRRDLRLRYVISRRRLYSSYPTVTRQPWEWGHYSGANPHTHHIHISVLGFADNDTRPWGLLAPPTPPFEEEEMIDPRLLSQVITDAEIDELFDRGVLAGNRDFYKQKAPHGIRDVPGADDWVNVAHRLTVAGLVNRSIR